MGQSSSVAAKDDDGSDNRSMKCHLQLNATMLTRLPLPSYVVSRFDIGSERFIFLIDSDGHIYMCELENADGLRVITTGWVDFLRERDARVGDFMVFDIESKDNVKVLVFRRDGSERFPGLDGGDRQLDLFSPVESPVGVAPNGSSAGDNSVLGEEFEKYKKLYKMGKGVELEGWMVQHFLASNNGLPPKSMVYVAKVERTSITKSRLRIPRDYTTSIIRPVMSTRGETFLLRSKGPDRTNVKMSVGKDGRATFTTGWADFANANSITTGSILGFSFSREGPALDIEVDVLFLAK